MMMSTSARPRIRLLQRASSSGLVRHSGARPASYQLSLSGSVWERVTACAYYKPARTALNLFPGNVVGAFSEAVSSRCRPQIPKQLLALSFASSTSSEVRRAPYSAASLTSPQLIDQTHLPAALVSDPHSECTASQCSKPLRSHLDGDVERCLPPLQPPARVVPRQTVPLRPWSDLLHPPSRCRDTNSLRRPVNVEATGAFMHPYLLARSTTSLRCASTWSITHRPRRAIFLS